MHSYFDTETMNKSKILSGEELVAKGAAKKHATLPEIGLKDVIPNGSWLEQKQIQAALEARKQLIEVERIEKCGVLSHAEWCEELMLAEVIKKTGSHWQFFGHNVGKKMFLNPEEALFLMEVNCLQLKYNEVTVSLHQAYSLLLRGKIALTQYKVYASLSRLGYKVFRHKNFNTTEYEKKKNDNENGTLDNIDYINVSNTKINEKNNVSNIENPSMEVEDVPFNNTQEHCSGSISNNNEKSVTEEDKIDSTTDKSDECLLDYYQRYLERLKYRKLTSYNKRNLNNFPENLDFIHKSVATLYMPDERYVPKNVFVSNAKYVINLTSVRTRPCRLELTESRSYSINDEVNGPHVRRVGSSAANETPQNNWEPPSYSNTNFVRQNFQFRQFNFCRPRTSINFFQFYNSFQRPILPNFYNFARFNVYSRPPPLFLRQFPYTANLNNHSMSRNRKRTRENSKYYHLEAIKRLAARLKQLIVTGNRQEENIQALQRLVRTYNIRYKAHLSLNEQFDITENEIIIETVELDDEEESKSKKRRLEDNTDKLNEHLNKLKQLALRLKDLEIKNNASSRHRRAFSNMIKTFNKSFNADIYLNDNYEVIDRRQITLTSSSDSDCIIEETPVQSGKKLKNPFYILKQLSAKQNLTTEASTSKDLLKDDVIVLPYECTKYTDTLLKTFNKNWLPNEDDFGRAEVPSGKYKIYQLMETNKEEYIYNFITKGSGKFDNWLDIKISFWKNVQETNTIFHKELTNINNSGSNSIITPEDCKDMASILKKISIIHTYKNVECDSNLNIDFDVYNRDVQNFRKCNRPQPHFRIVCISESTGFPSGIDIATLHSKYDDNVVIVFAVVGIGSISYLQMNPLDLPLYTPSNDLS